MQYYTARGGVRIAFERYGRTDDQRAGDLVFFNGLFSGTSSWAFQYRHRPLLNQFGLVFFDYRCQGASSQVLEPFLLEDVVRDVEGLLDFLPLRKPSFVGHSLGGILARRIAAAASEQGEGPASVVLVNSGGSVLRSTRMLFAQIRNMLDDAHHRGRTAPATAQSELRAIFRFLFPLFFGEDYLALIDGFESELIQGYIDYNRSPRSVVRLMEAVLSSGESGSEATVLGDMRCPVLVVTGSEEKIFPVHLVRPMIGDAPNVQFRVLERAGHACMIEQRHAFNELLGMFMASTYGVSV